MTFDVSALPGRAEELYQAAEDAERQASMQKDGPPPSWVVSGDRVRAIYNDFLDIPSPDDFTTDTDNLLEAMRQLATEGFSATNAGEDAKTLEPANSDLAGVNAAGVEIEDWTGDAADAFFTNYGSKFTPTASNLFCAYFVLRHAVNAEAAVWQTAREDLDQLSKDATEQMRHVRDSNQDDWTNALSVAGAVIAVGSAVPTGGASISGWAVASAGVTVASTGMGLYAGDGEKKDPMELANSNPDTIISEVERVLGEIKKKIKEGEAEINQAVANAVSSVTDQWQAFCLPRPALADVPRGDIHGDEHMGGV